MNGELELRTLLQDAAPAMPPLNFEVIANRAARRRYVRVGVGALSVAAGALSVALPVVLISSSSNGRLSSSHTSVIRGGRVVSTIYLSSSRDSTFAAPPSSAHSRLDASEAYEKASGSKATIPPGTSYQLGVLSSGPFKAVLAWGFSGQPKDCSEPTLAIGPDSTPGENGRCILWTFVDALTGRPLESLNQSTDGSATGRAPRTPTP